MANMRHGITETHTLDSRKIVRVSPLYTSSFREAPSLSFRQGAARPKPADMAQALADKAIGHLLAVVQKENHVSPKQRKALAHMLESMARQAVGLDTGRCAYSLPCGGGKTQGAIALIVAAHELGLGLTFAVATSQVEALCEFKRQLMGHGIPEQDIGLWHSLPVDVAKAQAGAGYASLPATPEEPDRPILLLSHEKIRRGNAPMFQGRPRSLVIWDESLIATRAYAVPISEIQAARGLAGQYAPALGLYLEKVADAVQAELAALRANPGRMPRVLYDILTPAEIAGMREALGQVNGQGAYIQAMRGTARAVLALLERPVSVVETSSGNAGDGVLRYDVLVPPELANIAILDASHSIRLLAQADASIIDRTSPEMREYRRYSHVRVRQIKIAAGKQHLRAGPEASKDVAREVEQAIGQAPADEGILIFTFKDSIDYLRRHMERLGIDLAQQITVDGQQRPRIQFLTWGQETSRNDMRRCRHVIMAGVLRRNPLELASSLTAQQQQPTRPRRNSLATLAEVSLSEMAHCVLQGMHRAACRTSDADGEAQRTDVLILVSGAEGLRDVLEQSLPGVQWDASCQAPRQRPASRTAQAVQAMTAYLTGLDTAVEKVSVKTLRAELGITLSKPVFREAVGLALAACIARDVSWRQEARSLVRAAG